MANHFRDHNYFSNTICKMPIYFKYQVSQFTAYAPGYNWQLI